MALILTVDRNSRNLKLLGQFLDRHGHRTVEATTLDEIDRMFEAHSDIGLALVDVAGFDQEIWSRCDRLRQEGIPFLVISPSTLHGVQEASIRHGAEGTLTKPLVSRELLEIIGSLLNGK